MSFRGKEVRFTKRFLRDTGQVVGDMPLKRGTVIRELPLEGGKFLLTIEDAAFGEWKSHSSNVEVIPNFRIVSANDEVLENDLLQEQAEDRLPSYLDEGVDAYLASD
ncbi:hypothetical protein [Marinobacter sp. SS13-12]|uniref:hypothetical protein n=1 Tax=Marinobacter sp. SS13-12 TaxID=3050451 RepID=UPI0025534318|nr:hypothetical protein [Marinobacter sp. SS13-12]MDK8465919.1 hypothetical protein [Marinobacter sp. SS13-12]